MCPSFIFKFPLQLKLTVVWNSNLSLHSKNLWLSQSHLLNSLALPPLHWTEIITCSTDIRKGHLVFWAPNEICVTQSLPKTQEARIDIWGTFSVQLSLLLKLCSQISSALVTLNTDLHFLNSIRLPQSVSFPPLSVPGQKLSFAQCLKTIIFKHFPNMQV